MNAEQILELVRAGFTKDDIISIITPGGDNNNTLKAPEVKATTIQAAAEGISAAGASEAPEPEKQETPASDPAENAVIKAMSAQIDTLTSAVDRLAKSVIAPSIGNVQPVGVEDIVRKVLDKEA